MKVLLIDDSGVMRRMEIHELQNNGVQDILQAANGEEGLKMLEQNMPIDMILLDINMPGIDGLSLLKKIKENPVYANVKIIMVTSESEKGKVLEAIRSGASDYIVKPFTPDEFKKRLFS